MHCASLGEFEQGRPVLEQFREVFPTWKIVLSFYSPSGYEQRKDYAGADHVTYLPLDTPAQATAFVEALAPNQAVFVKYEFWYYHLQALFARGIPTLLISAVFRPDQLFFRWYGGPFLSLLRRYTHVFVQDEASQKLLAQYGIHHVIRAGDTRIDRTMALATQPFEEEKIANFANGRSVLVVGSSWAPDEEIILPWLANDASQDWAVLLAPHEIGEPHLQQIMTKSRVPTQRYTQTTAAETPQARLLVLDTIGMLNKVYRYGQLAYIGGGFGAGIHNTLEPIAYDLPVIFGPRYDKFIEARALVATGGGFAIGSIAEFGRVFQQLTQTETGQTAVAALRLYKQTGRGATDIIMAYLQRSIG